MNTTNTLKVALIQSDLVWENPTENRKRFEKKINGLSDEIDLIVLPEMFTTGFTMNASAVAEIMEGETVQWLQNLAQEKSIAITGSIIISENNNFYNRLLFVHPSGKIDSYNKKHTFTLAGEHEVFSAGTERIIIDYKGWRICPLICYDLRFPVWARNTENYDLLLYVASWPKPRIEAWDSLLKARAIENMSYTIGVNRVGVDANGYEYIGNTACYDTLGNCLVKNNLGTEEILIIELNKQEQAKIRDRFCFLDDRDAFVIKK
ncbi:amidohydrolase [Tenacibaculum mesophilum]|uniref:Amidohydrolase n=1 Tax=Tenacibaculum mesophilum TaxID=104268 RepID=A0ABN5TB42_9FLAO|nr:amidohydrolase [Tenacibaculum mesophilum]AZJ33161.1 amidohydrolase [Tenacibaculum mesophilum]QFS28410.1 amidohydrolase [Tenacibaculum mesophilum]